MRCFMRRINDLPSEQHTEGAYQGTAQTESDRQSKAGTVVPEWPRLSGTVDVLARLGL